MKKKSEKLHSIFFYWKWLNKQSKKENIEILNYASESIFIILACISYTKKCKNWGSRAAVTILVDVSQTCWIRIISLAYSFHFRLFENNRWKKKSFFKDEMSEHFLVLFNFRFYLFFLNFLFHILLFVFCLDWLDRNEDPVSDSMMKSMQTFSTPCGSLP